MTTIRRSLLLVLCACVMASAPAGAASDDEAAVKAILHGFEEAWNRHDMDAFGRLFADDADFVNVRGTRWIGRPAIQEAHTASHAAQFKNSRLRVGETTLRFPMPEVAVARSLWDLEGHTTPTGEPQPARKGILTNVLAKGPAGWKSSAAEHRHRAATAVGAAGCRGLSPAERHASGSSRPRPHRLRDGMG